MIKLLSNRILAASFLAGAAALVYELLCQRYLLLILGGEAYTVAVVVGCYMVGLSSGSVIFGALADKRPGPALLFSVLGFAVFCGVSPAVYSLMDAFARYNSMAMRVLACFLFMLPATVCAGGVTPCLVKICHNLRSPAAVYAAYTLGSVAGALACGYLLIRYIGISASAWLAAALALLCAALAFFIKRAKEYKAEAQAAPVIVYSRRIIVFVIAAYCASGFASMVFQVFQTKMLVLFFRDSAYDFAVILTVYLAGLFIGNYIGGRVSAKRKDLLLKLIISQILAGAAVFAGLFIINIMPAATYDITSQTTMLERYGHNAFLMSNLIKAGYTAAVALPPAVLWGMGFPLVNRITAAAEKSAGIVNGLTIGLNTLFCAAGPLLSAFWLVDIFGIRGLIVFSGIICAVSGIALALAGYGGYIRHTGRKTLSIPAAIALAALLLAFLPGWNKFEMSTSFLVPGQAVNGSYNIMYYNEDAYGITSVVDFLPTAQKLLTTNRRFTQNSSDMNSPEDHRRLGLIPLLIHGNPKQVLTVGLGAGMTLRGADDFPGVSIDCVEISGAVARAARCFDAENGGVLDAANVSVIIDDGRNYIKNTKKSYDVIIADIFFPMSSGSSNLFSREYYELCKNRLNPGGLMVQWIPAHQFSTADLNITIKTFASVFPSCQLWYGLIGSSVPVIGIVGSEKDRVIDGARLSQLYAVKPLRDVLSQIGLDDEYTLLSHYIADVRDIPLDNAGIPINTDNNPILEYSNPENTAPFYQQASDNMGYVSYYKSRSARGDYCANVDKGKLEDYNIALFDYIYGIFNPDDSG